MEVYPPRDSHFAHRFVRVLHKSCAAQDIGTQACYLLCVIAHTEDAARYRGPARFWNSQLMETLGFTSPKQLDNARDAAIEAGWLHYDRAGNRQVGEYFVSIPEHFLSITDAPIEPANHSRSGKNKGKNRGTKVKRKAERIGNGSGNESETESGKPSNPIPVPIPFPIPKDTVHQAWNSTPGVVQIRSITKSREQHLAARLKEPAWPWEEALAKFPLKCFASDPGGWQPTFDWFIRPDTVTAILEGKYDWTKKENQNGKPATLPIGDGQRHNPGAELAWE